MDEATGFTMTSSKSKYALAAVALGAFAAWPFSGALANTASEIRALKAQLRALEAKVAHQGAEVHHATNVANAAHAKAGQHAPPPVFVYFKNGLFVETEDHAYSFKVGGRIQVDGGGISSPLNGRDGTASFRRARLEVEGKAANIWIYKLQYDFAGGSTAPNSNGTTGNGQGALGGIRDAYLGLRHPWLSMPFAAAPVLIQVGSMYEPFGLDALNSSKYIDFIERPLGIDAIAPFRHVGLSAGAYGENWTAKVGVYTTSFEDANASPTLGVGVPFYVPKGAGWVGTGGGQYVDVAGRLTYAPIKTEHDLIHLGVAGRYHSPNDSNGNNDDRVLRIGSNLRSEANVLGQSLLGAPDLSCGSVIFPSTSSGIAGHCVRDVFSYGVELALAHGPFTFQGEYMGSQYSRDSGKILQARLLGNFAPGGSSQSFSGWYAYGQYWLTGEERAEAYSVKDANGASFEQVKIKSPFSAGGPGAWGFGLRYSAVNLNSGPYSGSGLYNMIALAPTAAARNVIANAGVAGGRQEDLTAGINWYPDNGIHFQANWTRVMHISAPLNGSATQGAYFNGAHPNLFEMRAQVYW